MFTLLLEEAPEQAPTKKNKRKKKSAITHAEDSTSRETREGVSERTAAEGDAASSLEGFQQVPRWIGALRAINIELSSKMDQVNCFQEQ